MQATQLQSYKTIVNDKTNPLSCPPTFIRLVAKSAKK